MGRDTCKMLGCDKPPRSDKGGLAGKFCSTEHELKYDHIKADADQARRDAEERHGVDRSDLPEYDGPPY